jgi:diguanylate cyclase (GGDEF)-like protein
VDHAIPFTEISMFQYRAEGTPAYADKVVSMRPQTSPAVQSGFIEAAIRPLKSNGVFKTTADEQALEACVAMRSPDIGLHVSCDDEIDARPHFDANSTISAMPVPSSIPSLIAGPTLSSERRPTILVVDDEPLYLDLIADILGTDYKILVAEEGMTGLEIAANNVPHLILLDLMMPGMDGFEVYRCLKADRRTSEIPVIFITGAGDLATETKGLKMGAVDYINKPINPDLTKARVNTQINFKLMRDKLLMLAATDGLTGLANRFHFDGMLAYEYARHMRSGKELALIMLDIDQFKAFNDTYGHISGDECLREIARAMTRTISRSTDLVARYGGEEFVVLLPETCLRGAVILAERIRNCIGGLALPHKGSCMGHVTASLGVVSGRFLTGSSIVDVLTEADVQLYAAKAGGRNRVAFRAIGKIGLTH